MNTELGEFEALSWLKDSAAAEPNVSPDLQAQLWTRLTSDISALAVGGAGAATALGSPATFGSGTWRRVVASRLALWSAPALVAGAAAGVTGHAVYAPERVRTVYVEPRAPEPVSTAVVASVESLPLEPEPATTDESKRSARAERASALPSAEPRAENALKRERAVLDPARRALAAGEPARALEQATRHATEFPTGILSEEREAIAINALVSLGQYARANQRAVAFHARYPQSLMTHSVDAALAAVPKQ